MARKRKGLVSPYLNIGLGDYTSLSPIHKFGHNNEVGTSYEVLADNNVYRTPQVSGATALRVKAGGNANDTAAGTGAREVTLQGLDQTGALVEELLATAGTSASAATTTTFIRLFRAWVSQSGSYATTATGSHAGEIIIEDSGGNEDWGYMLNSAYPEGQTAIAAYSVPLGKTAYILSLTMALDATKEGTILGFKRENILQASAPFSARRMFFEFGGISGVNTLKPNTPFGPFPALTDIGFMGKVIVGTGQIGVDFIILLVDNDEK